MSKKRIIKLSVGIVIVFLFAGVGLFVNSKYVIPIAMYHYVKPDAKKKEVLVVSPETFDKQMSFLSRHKYNVINLDEVADLINNKKKVPPKTLSINFDDGYEDNFVYAFPILQKYKIKATIFLIVDFIGKQGYLNWDQIQKMHDSGLIVFGSHTMTHPFLETLKTDEELQQEIKKSKLYLEEKLKDNVYALAYPCGRFTDRVKAFVKDSGYKAAVATNPGKKCKDNDVYALKRLRISENAKSMFVFWVETSGYYNLMRENRHK